MPWAGGPGTGVSDHTVSVAEVTRVAAAVVPVGTVGHRTAVAGEAPGEGWPRLPAPGPGTRLS